MLGLGILLVVDLVLVLWALWPTSVPARPGADAVASAAPGGSPSDSGSATARPLARRRPSSPSASPTERRRPARAGTPHPPRRRPRWSSRCGRRTPVRATRRDRPRQHRRRPAVVERPQPGSVTRLRPGDRSAGFVVGGGEGCELRFWRTSNGGEQWSGTQSAASAWGRSASDARLVHRPEAAPVTPCPRQESVLDLVGLGRYTAAVLCRGESSALDLRRWPVLGHRRWKRPGCRGPLPLGHRPGCRGRRGCRVCRRRGPAPLGWPAWWRAVRRWVSPRGGEVALR